MTNRKCDNFGLLLARATLIHQQNGSTDVAQNHVNGVFMYLWPVLLITWRQRVAGIWLIWDGDALALYTCVVRVESFNASTSFT